MSTHTTSFSWSGWVPKPVTSYLLGVPKLSLQKKHCFLSQLGSGIPTSCCSTPQEARPEDSSHAMPHVIYEHTLERREGAGGRGDSPYPKPLPLLLPAHSTMQVSQAGAAAMGHQGDGNGAAFSTQQQAVPPSANHSFWSQSPAQTGLSTGGS